MKTDNKEVEQQGLKTQQTGRRIGTTLWVIILTVYLALLSITGYITFFYHEENPAVDVSPEWLNRFADPEARKQVLDGLREDAQIFKRKRELATQSFNVVLGALLGFLSASAVSATPNKAHATGAQEAARG